MMSIKKYHGCQVRSVRGRDDTQYTDAATIGNFAKELSLPLCSFVMDYP